ncbi:MAG: 50S ribosomal protein L25 [Desulfofustis sp. PB-SRB1]|jgi:large subunit ribosomal protein L25|nr:50S ribosomal protein L25 [Desulfofustis sp. PB-SRB1]MBM1001186.1 50S ribosomal protein L25 [Desulfofustis sp. PB-SRB1]HBH29414.1 50S ribosomal protein L25 [Desulfofustis sp.]HBH32704.1 50S ribosomal protein L25 [Desulfofustis sp.]
MITKELSGAARHEFGKGPMRRLRAAGKTPAVVYKGGENAVALQFETKVLFNELIDIQGRNAVLTLTLDDGSQKHVIVKEIQTDPVRDTLYHADFLEIDLNKRASFFVPVRPKGKSKGEDRGGIVSIETTRIQVEGLPLTIPDSCTVDISSLQIGQSITVGDIDLPADVSLITSAEQVFARVSAP